MDKFIDLRSDTVTRPSDEMRRVMMDAEVGDDVYKEDPTVIRLEKMAAEILGKEAALFVPSGVMGNQICLKVLTSPGDEIICHKNSHIFNFESGSPAMLSGIQMVQINSHSAVMNPDDIEEHIRPVSAYYMPRTRLITIENTHNMAGGIIQPVENIKEIHGIAEKHNLYMHLDGARLWNASAASGIDVAEYASYFDTLMVCLSKGLGAPVGSIIAGTKGVIEEAFRIRKAFGGGMRQIGILAAAGIYALENNREKLADDHRKARLIAESLSQIENVDIDLNAVQTNIIIFRVKNNRPADIIEKFKEKNILISSGLPGTLRIVTHLDISMKETIYTAGLIKEIFN